jgi:hypothetical protein
VARKSQLFNKRPVSLLPQQSHDQVQDFIATRSKSKTVLPQPSQQLHCHNKVSDFLATSLPQQSQRLSCHNKFDVIATPNSMLLPQQRPIEYQDLLLMSGPASPY